MLWSWLPDTLPAFFREIAAQVATSSARAAVTEVAPYVTTWSWPGLAALREKPGLRAVTLAFVTADGGCAPALDITRHQGDLDAFRRAGGRIRASFGGAAGAMLEVACSDPGSLARATNAFVERTGIVDLDLDVEQESAMTVTVNRRRAEAMRAVQAQRGVTIGVTLAATPEGLSARGLDVIRSLLAAGVRVSRVNLMTMELGAARPMGELAIAALGSAHAQLRAMLPSLSDAEAWAMLGATPMIGPNRSRGQAFTLADARALAAFARRKHLGLLSYWALQRDRGFAYHEAFRAGP